MKRFLLFLALVPMLSVAKKPQPQKTDREVWVDIMYQMAEPVMKNMAEGKLQLVMDTAKGNKNLELSPTWDNRDKKVAYMEAFGRLLAGLAPWLNLPDDDTASDGRMAVRLSSMVLMSLKVSSVVMTPSGCHFQRLPRIFTLRR